MKFTVFVLLLLGITVLPECQGELYDQLEKAAEPDTKRSDGSVRIIRSVQYEDEIYFQPKGGNPGRIARSVGDSKASNDLLQGPPGGSGAQGPHGRIARSVPDGKVYNDLLNADPGFPGPAGSPDEPGPPGQPARIARSVPDDEVNLQGPQGPKIVRSARSVPDKDTNLQNPRPPTPGRFARSAPDEDTNLLGPSSPKGARISRSVPDGKVYNDLLYTATGFPSEILRCAKSWPFGA